MKSLEGAREWRFTHTLRVFIMQSLQLKKRVIDVPLNCVRHWIGG